MTLRFISTKVHGYIDYLTAAIIPLLPRTFGWSRQVTRLHDVIVTGTTASSFLTNYEMGGLRVLPMKAHLTLDAAVGGLLLTSAAVLKDEAPSARAVMAGLGLFSLAMALMTETQSRPERQQRRAMPVEGALAEQRAGAAEVPVSQPAHPLLASGLTPVGRMGVI